MTISFLLLLSPPPALFSLLQMVAPMPVVSSSPFRPSSYYHTPLSVTHNSISISSSTHNRSRPSLLPWCLVSSRRRSREKEVQEEERGGGGGGGREGVVMVACADCFGYHYHHHHHNSSNPLLFLPLPPTRRRRRPPPRHHGGDCIRSIHHR